MSAGRDGFDERQYQLHLVDTRVSRPQVLEASRVPRDRFSRWSRLSRWARAFFHFSPPKATK